MTEEPKPCPFCERAVTEHNYCYDRINDDILSFGCCAHIETLIDVQWGHTQEEWDLAVKQAEERLIARWNTRANEKNKGEV